VAKVAVIVNRHATDIHAHFARHDRGKNLLFTSQGVVDFQHKR
jgi:hypothetical protein